MSKQRRYRSTEWAGLLDQWARSGESAERFAARLGVKPITLSRWQSSLSASKAKTAVVGVPKADPGGSLFTPVQVVRAPREQRGMVEVMTRSGCVVRVHGPVDDETLSAVLGALGAC